MCVDTAFVIYSYKSLRQNIWNIDLLSNKWLLFSSVVVLVAFSAAIYLPPLQTLLHTVPLDITSWAVLITLAIISVFLVEGTKYFFISKDRLHD